MKFTVDAKKFKTMMEAAISIASRSAVDMCKIVRIDWSANEIHILSANLGEYFDGKLCDTVENADDVLFNVCGIYYDLLDKVYKMTGKTITVTIDEDYNVTFSNGKKALNLIAKEITPDDVVDLSYFTDDFEKCFTIPNEELAESLTKLDNFRSKTNIKPILEGFQFDCEKKRIVAIDGYHAAIKYLKMPFENNEANFVVGGSVSTFVKKYFNKYADTDVSINKKCAEFKTSDMIYSLRFIEGEFHPIDGSIPRSYEALFEFNADDVVAICKDYSKYISAKAPMPIVLCKGENDSRFFIGLRSSGFKVCTETAGTTEYKPSLTIGYKNQFTKDCFELFKGKNCTAKYSGNLRPLVVESEDNDYLGLLLPVRLPADTKAEDFVSLIKSA